MTEPALLGIDRGLLDRFRAAGETIRWREANSGSRSRTPSRIQRPRRARWRIAHLHDEEARIEEEEVGRRYVLVTDSGPVGALVLLLEIDRRGLPRTLEALDSKRFSRFPGGALQASWSSQPLTNPARAVPLSDVVGLARYALR